MTEHTQIDKIRSWHEAIVDFMLQNPHLNQGDCARHLNKTESWLSTLINTDLFREYKARRFGDHHDRVSHSVIERVSGLAGLSLEVLHERITAEREKIPLGIVKDSAELMLKSLGYGPKPVATTQSPIINLNLYAAPPKVLAEARDDLRRVHE